MVVDTIYPKRLKHIPELQKMGMQIEGGDGRILINHTDQATLRGADVEAGEIRAGASLVITGLMAQGQTVIHKADNILRGYDRIIWKLNRLNADVKIEDE